MLRFLGVIFIACVLGGAATALSYISDIDFVLKFAQDQSLQVMATALALNVATITFLAGSFLTLERGNSGANFDATRRELKHNILAMALIFIINYFVVLGINQKVDVTSLFSVSLMLGFFSSVLTFVFGALVVEISLTVLKIKNTP